MVAVERSLSPPTVTGNSGLRAERALQAVEHLLKIRIIGNLI
jgi:hypothetical protein